MVNRRVASSQRYRQEDWIFECFSLSKIPFPAPWLFPWFTLLLDFLRDRSILQSLVRHGISLLGQRDIAMRKLGSYEKRFVRTPFWFSVTGKNHTVHRSQRMRLRLSCERKFPSCAGIDDNENGCRLFGSLEAARTWRSNRQGIRFSTLVISKSTGRMFGRDTIYFTRGR